MGSSSSNRRVISSKILRSESMSHHSLPSSPCSTRLPVPPTSWNFLRVALNYAPRVACAAIGSPRPRASAFFPSLLSCLPATQHVARLELHPNSPSLPPFLLNTARAILHPCSRAVIIHEPSASSAARLSFNLRPRVPRRERALLATAGMPPDARLLLFVHLPSVQRRWPLAPAHPAPSAPRPPPNNRFDVHLIHPPP